MFYSIRHITRFTYKASVSESFMEVRMQPRSEGNQGCLSFQLSVKPATRVMSYRDYLGNTIHHFNVPGAHSELIIVAAGLVDLQPPMQLPQALRPEAWDELDRLVAHGDYWDFLVPSTFATKTAALEQLMRDLNITRRDDPLRLLRELNTSLYHWFSYEPNSTRVDSPIDETLRSRKGVCQDFAHVMITMVRQLGIPCRYVSGYLYRSPDGTDRSVEGATHAWVEALLPSLGWVGFDPTNNRVAAERHIRTAIGRDYADVPPTHGVFKGSADGKLEVNVRVAPSDEMPAIEEELTGNEDWTTLLIRRPGTPTAAGQQQQTQQ